MASITRNSVVTVRSEPVAGTTSVSGPLHVRAETVTIITEKVQQVVDLTDMLMPRIAALGVREGLVTIASQHTTCALFINENQVALCQDIELFLKQVVDADTPWMHNDPEHSDCDRRNAGSHLRAMLLGHSVTLQISGGELVLGQWQRVLMAELDGPRSRTVRLQAMGVA